LPEQGLRLEFSVSDSTRSARAPSVPGISQAAVELAPVGCFQGSVAFVSVYL